MFLTTNIQPLLPLTGDLLSLSLWLAISGHPFIHSFTFIHSLSQRVVAHFGYFGHFSDELLRAVVVVLLWSVLSCPDSAWCTQSLGRVVLELELLLPFYFYFYKTWLCTLGGDLLGETAPILKQRPYTLVRQLNHLPSGNMHRHDHTAEHTHTTIC